MDKQGSERVYESVLLRRTYRDGPKVRNETLANLSMLPEAAVAALEATLKGHTLVPAGQEFTVMRTLPHGHVAAVAAMARGVGLPGLLGPPCRPRDLALGLIISRVIFPASKLSTLSRWGDCTLGADLQITGASTDEVYAAMDWLAERQDAIEKKLAAKHLAPEANPSRMALFDLTSSWVTGRHCEVAARGYSRDRKKGLAQIEYGILTDPAGRPVAVRVFSGDTADPTAFTDIVEVIRVSFGLDRLVLVGDRGMITSARIEALRELNDAGAGFGWITALRAPAIAKLAAEDGPLQMSLFDQHDLAEISHPDYPGERLIACRNPALAAERTRKRDELLAATEAALTHIGERVARGSLAGAGRIGEAVGRVINKYKMGKHFHRRITDTGFTFERDHAGIAAEAALDGIYVLRTSLPEHTLATNDVVARYKGLEDVERFFRTLNTELDIRPIRHRLADRVRAHVFLRMLSYYLVWNMKQALAPILFHDNNKPAAAAKRANTVAAAQRSDEALAKAARKRTTDNTPVHSFTSLLADLATLCANQIQPADDMPAFTMTTTPTPLQRRAFELLGVSHRHRLA